VADKAALSIPIVDKAKLTDLERRSLSQCVAVLGKCPTGLFFGRSPGGCPACRVTGMVADVRTYVAERALYVVPRRVCGGTRLEILEASAMGKAVVSAGVGAERLPIVSGQGFLRAECPEDFARAVRSLLKDPGRRQTLWLAGRRRVEERYSRGPVAPEFERHCEEVASGHAH
jgi:glycosyltransferase involved in cell wall biosynthesis